MATHPYIYVRNIALADISELTDLLSASTAQRPLVVSLYDGRPPSQTGKVVRSVLASSPGFIAEGVEFGGALVGASVAWPPGTCRPSFATRVRVLSTALTLGLGVATRVSAAHSTWRRHDPTEPHLHLGAIAVDRRVENAGIKELLVLRHVRRLDATGLPGYVSTDSSDEVDFFAGFGYAVREEHEVVGVRCWTMRRPAL